jgi:beta propeller repeat protein
VNLTNTANDQEFLTDIDDGNVVWTHTASNIPGDIVLYDIAQGTATTIAASDLGHHFEEPAIRGHYVTFLQVGTQIDVALYDVSTGTTSLITNDAAEQGHPRVGTDMVVYEDYNTGIAQVAGYRISTGGLPALLAPGTDSQVTPDIDGNTVIWVQSVAGADQIFALDLVTNTVTQLTTSFSHKVLPRISGNRIVWSDDRAGNLDLYIYDLGTHSEQPLVTGAGDQFLADIDGDRVVYTANQNGFEQVYLFTVGDFSISSNPTNVSLQQGTSGTSLISTENTLGIAQTISLSVAGIPSGASASLNPTSVTAGGNSTLTVSAGTATPGMYTLVVTGVEGSATHTTSVTLSISQPYVATVGQPINADGSSVFNANRGVIPVNFTLTMNGTSTCTLPPAMISLTRTAGAATGAIDESVYEMSADNGSTFRISGCQYLYNLAAKTLGAGTYRIDITIGGTVVGSAVFALK